MFLLFEPLRLFEHLPYRTQRYSIFHALLYDSLPGPLIHLRLLVFVPLHRVRLPRPSLSIREYSRMEPVHNLPDKPLNLELVEYFLLTVL